MWGTKDGTAEFFPSSKDRSPREYQEGTEEYQTESSEYQDLRLTLVAFRLSEPTQIRFQ